MLFRRHNLPGFSKPGFSRLVRRLGPHLPAQFLVLLTVSAVIFYLGGNVVATMHRLGIQPGFGFLNRPANFEIGESLIAFSASDTYGRALLSGLVNTINVAFFGCVLATVLGTTLGIAGLSGNLLLSRAVRVYVELFRNTPLLLQLFLWSTIFHALPSVRNAYGSFGVFLSNRGIFMPKPVFAAPALTSSLVVTLLATTIVALVLRRLLLGQRLYTTKLILCAVATAWLASKLTGLTMALEFPAKKAFNITGGLSLTPEFAALLAGLVFNAAATIAEIVRSGIHSVPRGQWDAARSLGLRAGFIMRFVIMPQALRVMIPLMTSSYLDLTKNSSLAVAIGFPDLVSVANTTANTTGQTLEAVAIITGAFLLLNLCVSLAMNLYNGRRTKTGF